MSHTITLNVTNDMLIEGDEGFSVTLTAVSSGDSIGSPSTATGTIQDNDTLLVEFNQATGSSAEASGLGLPQLIVTGEVQTGHTVTIDVSVQGTTTAAGGGEDYTDPATLTVPAGSYTAAAFAIPDLTIVDDPLVEPDETIDLGNIAGSQITVAAQDSTSYTIDDDDTLQVEFSQATGSDAEDDGGDLPTLLVTGEVQDSYSVEVSVDVAGGSATGADYTNVAAMTIGAGFYDDTVVPINLAILPDDVVEPDETIELTLSTTSPQVTLGTLTDTEYTILDDDTLAVEFSQAAGSDAEDVGENLPTLLVTGEVQDGYSVEVSVDVTGGSATGADYTNAAVVTLGAGSYDDTAVPINLAILPDDVVEPDETIELTLSTGSPQAALGAQDMTEYTIEDDDTLLVEFSQETNSDLEDLGGNLPQLLVTGDVQEGHTVTIDVSVLATSTATGGGEDYADPATLTVPAGSYTATGFAIPDLAVVDDTLIEPHEMIDLGDITGSQITVGAQDTTSYTILDDDTLLVEFDRATAGDAEELGGNLPQVLVTGEVQEGHSVTIDVVAQGTSTATGGGEDYEDATTLTVCEGTYEAAVFPIPGLAIVDEPLVELDETIDLGLDGSQITVGDQGSTSYTIDNDDAAVFSFEANPQAVEGENVPFVINLSNPVDVATSVTVTTFDSTAKEGDNDYTPLTDFVVTFDPEVTQVTVNVATTDDNKVEADELFNLQMVALDDGGRDVVISYPNDFVAGKIINDDTAAVTLTGLTPDEGSSGAMAALGLFEISLSDPVKGLMTVDKPVTVLISTAAGTATAGTDYTDIVNQSVTFAPGESTKTIEVQVNGDLLVEADETVDGTLSGLVSPYPTRVTLAAVPTDAGTIVNDDTATLTVSDVTENEGDAGTVTYTFDVTLSGDVYAPFSVDVQTQDDTAQVIDNDYAENLATLDFAGTANETYPFTVTVNGDEKVEADELFQVILSNLTGLDPSAAAAITFVDGTGTITNDDAAEFSVERNVNVDEGDIAEFTVILSSPVDVPTSVTVSTRDGTATTADDDYTPLLPLVVTFEAGQVSKVFDVQTTADDKVERDETFDLFLTGLNAGGRDVTISPTKDFATAKIVNDDAAVVSIDSVEQDEDAGEMEFTVSLSQAVDVAVSVTVSTADDTAMTDDSDYTAKSEVLTFAAGELTKTFTVAVTEDVKVEADETFTVGLSGLSAGGRSVSISATEGTGTIQNDDQAEISIDNVSQAEDSGAMVFTVTLSAPVDVAVSITATTAEDTATEDEDYEGKTEVLTFAAGELTKTFTVQVTADDTVEDDETFTVDLSDLDANGREVAISDTADSGTGTIENDDLALFSIDSVSQEEGDDGITEFTFTVTLSHPCAVPVSVDYETADDTAADGSDYMGTSDTLTFSPGDPLTQTITVEVQGDTTVENDETFTVTLSNPLYDEEEDDSRVDLDAEACVGTGTILNDDVALLQISSPTITEGDDGETTMAFEVTVDLEVAGGFTVAFRVADVTATAGTDYMVTTASPLEFDGSANETQTIEVTIYGDLQVEADETFTVTLGDVTAATEAQTAAVTSGAEGTGTIENDDSAEFRIGGNVDVAEGSGAVFTVFLTREVDVATSVTVTTDDDRATVADSDYAPLDGFVVTFPAGSTEQTFTVNTTADSKVELDETFIASLVGVAAGGRDVAIAEDADFATARILNDDSATVSLAGVELDEGNSEAAAPLGLFVINLSNPVDVDLTVEFSTQEGGTATEPDDYTAQTSIVVTIPANATSVTHSVGVVGDLTVEPDETVNGSIGSLESFTRNVSLGTTTATATILNDDNTPPTAEDDSGEGFQTDEDTAFTTANVLDNDEDPDPDETLSVVAFDTTDTLGQVTDNEDGTFGYDPNGQFDSLPADETATDTFTYTVGDTRGGTDTATVTITIIGVNDPAVIEGTATGEVTEDADPDTVSGALTVTDPDTGENQFQMPASLAGQYGSFSFETDGAWTYTLDNEDPDTDALPEGAEVEDTLSVTSQDGTATAVVTVTITGANDAPTLDYVRLQLEHDGMSTITPPEIESLFHDVDGDDLVMLKIVELPLHGTLQVTLVGNPIPQPVTEPNSEIQLALVESLTYQSLPDYRGQDSYTWTASDGIEYAAPARVTITSADDIVGRNQYGYLWVAKSNGSNAFNSSIWGQWSTARTWTDVMVGDFNGDGYGDLVGRNEFGYWWVATSDGSGAFTSAIWGKWEPSRTWTNVMVGDFNEDGNDDLVARNEFGYWWVATSNGAGAFTSAIWGKWDPARTWTDVMVGDFNKDGRSDLVARNEFGYWWVGASNGGGAFTNAIWGKWDPARTWSDVMVGDFNDDGADDLIGRNEFGYWWVAKSNGSNALSNAIWGQWSTARTWTDVMVGDFDGNGADDVVGRNDYGYWWVAKSNGTDALTSGIWGQWDTARQWTDVMVGDFNCDGDDDVLGRDGSNDWWVGKSNGWDQFANEYWGSWNDVDWLDVLGGNFGD